MEGVRSRTVRALEADGIRVVRKDFAAEVRGRGIDPEALRQHFEVMGPKLSGRNRYPVEILGKGLVFGEGAGEFDAMLYLDSDMLLQESLDPLLEGRGEAWGGGKLDARSPAQSDMEDC